MGEVKQETSPKSKSQHLQQTSSQKTESLVEQSILSRQSNPIGQTISRISSTSSLKAHADILNCAPDHSRHVLLQLQRQYGNRYVQQVVQQARQTERSKLQAKLTLGAVGDKYEREADRVAKEVVSNISSASQQPVQRMEPEEEELAQMKPDIQRMETGTATEVDSSVEDTIQQARGSGHSLAENVRVPMEQAFGADFSGVRVHTDSQSHQLNQSIQARAFTTGQDIFFRQGEYNLGTTGGQELLAHELTHIVQQNGSVVQCRPKAEPQKFSVPNPCGVQQILTVSKTLQRYLELEIDQTNKLQNKTPSEAYEIILAGLNKGDDEVLRKNWMSKTNKPKIENVLREWIDAPKADQKNKNREMNAITRQYTSYKDIATAILDRVSSQVGIAIEEELASVMQADQHVHDKLVLFVKQTLVPWVEGKREQLSEIHKEIEIHVSPSSRDRRYLPYILDKKDVSIYNILEKAESQSNATILSAIHDICDILYQVRELRHMVEVPEEKLQGKVVKNPPLPSFMKQVVESEEKLKGKEEKEEQPEFEVLPYGKYRGKGATPIQSNVHVGTAGKLGYPVSMGPSRTTGKLMMFAESFNVPVEIKEAIAWALFALWYKDYRRDLTDIHRYHFVMDMAANFGVEYNPVDVPRRPGGGDFKEAIKKGIEKARKDAKKLLKGTE